MIKCMNPRCKKVSICRGLCRVCYGECLRLIAKGLATWETLEAAGKCRISIYGRGKNAWFREAGNA